MSNEEKKGCQIYSHRIGNMKIVTGCRCLDCNEMCIYDGHEEQWHGESEIYFYKCPKCAEQYYAEQGLVDTSA